MPIKPPIRPATEGDRRDDGTSEPLGTAPVPKEIKTPQAGRGQPRDTELDRQKKVFEKRADRSTGSHS